MQEEKFTTHEWMGCAWQLNDWERERELFFYIQMTEDQFSDCLSDAFLLCYCVSTASWLYVQGVVGLGKEKFLVHYEFVSMKYTFNEG